MNEPPLGRATRDWWEAGGAGRGPQGSETAGGERNEKSRKEIQEGEGDGGRKPHYPLPEAVATVTKTAFAKFDETVEVAMRLGVDPKHADQMVRGTVILPHGLGGQGQDACSSSRPARR